jgi:hypothetical protein
MLRHFSDAEKTNKWARLVAPIKAEGVSVSREAPGPAPVQSPLTLFATLLSPAKTLSHTFERTKGYIHVVQTSGYNTGKSSGNSVKVTGGDGNQDIQLQEGDGAYIYAGAGQSITVENVGDGTAEVLLFDIE